MKKLAIIATVLAGSLLLVGCGAASPSGNTSTPNGGSSGLLLKILPPATIRPVVRECHQTLQLSADGNASPLICSSGGLNVLAWNFYATLGTNVMSLGPLPPSSEITTAMCSDMQINHATTPEEQNAAALASDYYGWGLASQLEGTIQSCS